ncbi:MAG: hypothetical protein LC723_13810 [Actinobacteria bacterium]|nr:hypothetical protein [Actinomycetota bacterium]
MKTATIALVCIVFAACSSGKDEPTIVVPTSQASPTSQSPFPKAKQRIAITAANIEAAAADDTCVKMAALIHPYLRDQKPEDAQQQCRTYLGFTKGMKVLRSAEYGSGAVIDYSYDSAAGQRPTRTMLLALDKDSKFKAFAVDADRQSISVGTQAPPKAKTDQVAAAIVGAIRSGDCNAMFSLAHPGLAPGAGDLNEFCGQYNQSGLQAALRADTGAIAMSMGGNAIYAFYALRVKPDRYYTLAFARVKSGDFKFISELRVGP